MGKNRTTPKTYILTPSHKLGQVLFRLCKQMGLDPIVVEDGVPPLTRADFVIADIVNNPQLNPPGDRRTIRIVSEPSFPPRQNELINPFTMQQAAAKIEQVFWEEWENDLPASFWRQLLLAHSDTDVLNMMSEYLIANYPCDRVGIFSFDDDMLFRWMYWYNEPNDNTQAYLTEIAFSDREPLSRWVRVPFIAGSVIGGMFVHLKTATTESLRVILREIANITARVWIQQISLMESQQYASELKMFDVLGRAIVEQLNLRDALSLVANSARDIVHAQGAVIWLRRDDALVVETQSGAPAPLKERIPLEEGEYLTQTLLGMRQSTIVGDFNEDKLFPLYSVYQTLCVPLSTQSDPIGVIQVVNPLEHVTFSTQDAWRLRNLASWSVIAVSNAELHQKAQESLQIERLYRTRLVQTEKLTALGRLVASVAHEVNNPLQIAQSCLDLTYSRLLDADKDVRENLKVVQESIDQIREVIARVQTLHRIPDKHPKDIDLNDLLEQVVTMVGHMMRNSSVQSKLELTRPLPRVRCLPHELRQVFLNLVLNAIEAMGQGGGTLSIRSDFVRDDDRVAVSITDTGGGIPEDVLDTIFEPFVTTKADGSGLGLAVSQNIIQGYGGKITIVSSPSSGSTFTVWLPVSEKVEMR